MNKAIGYIRVSTERQASEGVSLEAQRARIQAWCEVNGYELANVFVDAGVSGKSMDKRQGLKDALAAVKKGDALVVYSLSRLARSTTDALHIAERLQKMGADLVSLSDKFDTTTATGKMVFTVMAAMNQLERDLAAERTKAALAYKKAAGEVYSPVPFGFQAVEGRLEQVEAEAVVVADILAMRQGGSSLQAIADSLNERGIEGKRGGKWFPSTVRYVVQRQAA